MTNSAMETCIHACRQCQQICLQTAMTHCLAQGGKHTAPEHFRLMLSCAELCQTAANFMLSQTNLHGVVCAACAEICGACADSCEDIGDMDDCVQACRHCAQECQTMSQRPTPDRGRAAAQAQQYQ